MLLKHPPVSGWLRHWGARLALGAVLFAAMLACRTADVLVAQAPKPTSTRTPRPTFTPIPPATDTPEPTPTNPPPPPTPTRPPTPRPTRRPPTLAPPPPPPPPAATTPPYRYKSTNKGCEHSGQTFIQGTVYHGQDHVNGVTIALSGGGPDGGIATTRTSGDDGDGFFSVIVNAFGASPGEKRWVWVVENGKRASDIVEFDFNNLKDDNPASCWRGFVDFIQLY